MAGIPTGLENCGGEATLPERDSCETLCRGNQCRSLRAGPPSNLLDKVKPRPRIARHEAAFSRFGYAGHDIDAVFLGVV